MSDISVKKQSYEELEKANAELTEQLVELKEKVVNLNVAKKKYDFLVNHVPDIMYQLDDDGNILFVSDTVEQYGYDADELTGKSILDIVHPDDRYKAMYHLNDRRTGKRGTKDIEIRLIAKSNEAMNFDIRSKDIDQHAPFLFSSEGLYKEGHSVKRSFLGTMGIARDITERKQAELALKDSERLLASIFVSILEGITVIDKDFNVVLVNDVMRKWYADEAILEGRKCYDCFKGRDEACEQCPSQDSLKSGKTESKITRGVPDSAVEWLEVFSYPIYDQDTGSITGVVEFVRNITERVNAEKILAKTREKLVASEKKYRNLLENTNDITVTFDIEGIISFISPQIEKYGYTPEEMTGQNILSFVYPEDREQAQADFERTLTTGDEFPTEFRFVDKKGRIRWIEDYSKAYHNSDGDITELTGVMRDVTERKKAEQLSEQLIIELNNKIEEIKQMHGVIPICSHCKKIRDDEGYWEKVEKYIQEHTEARFSHGICPDCMKEHYQLFADSEHSGGVKPEVQ